MKRIYKKFIEGRIYSDLPDDEFVSRVYFQFIKVDLKENITYFKQVGEYSRYRLNADGLIEFDYPTMMYQYSQEETSKLKKKGIINI